jgi:hypothetical protein
MLTPVHAEDVLGHKECLHPAAQVAKPELAAGALSRYMDGL